MKSCGLVSAVLVALTLLICPAAVADAPTHTLQGAFDAMKGMLAEPHSEAEAMEMLGAVGRIVGGLFDFQEASRLALGPDWAVLTRSEQEEFVGHFGSLLDRALILRVAAMAKLEGGLGVRFVRERVDNDRAVVFTTLATRDGGELPIDYRMRRRGERWAVTDIVIAGVSVAANYRAQFARILRTASPQDLLEMIRTKAPPSLPRPGPTAGSVPVVVVRASSTPLAPATMAAPPALTTESPTTAAPTRIERVARPEPPVPAELAGQTEPPALGDPLKRPERSAAAPAPVAPLWVQVGAFRNPDVANRVATALLRRQLPVTLGASGPLLRVRIGPFSTRMEAKAKLRELERQGYRGFVTASRD